MIADTTEGLERYFRTEGGPAIQSAYLFGSHAAGRAHRESDVDVAVLLDRSRYRTRRERAEFATRLNADPETDHAYVRDVQLRAADLAIFLNRMRAIKLERLRA